MRKIKGIAAAALAAVLVVVLIHTISSAYEDDRYVKVEFWAQGGSASVTLNLKGSSLTAEQLKAGIDSIITLVDTTLSGYNNNSILCRYNRGDNPELNPLFVDIFNRGMDFYEETDGALDFAAGPVFSLWGFDFNLNPDAFPSEEKVEETVASCGLKTMERGVVLKEGFGPQRLNYNAIAQGYTCDLIAEFLHRFGVKDMLVDIGEIYCEGLNPDRKPWTLGVDEPYDGNDELGKDVCAYWTSEGRACGVVTSGNYRKFTVRDGKKYSHTIDPRTGYPVQHNLLSATVVAPTSAAADAYATYCMVIGLEQMKEFIGSRPDLEALAVYAAEDGTMQMWKSEGFTSSK